VIFIFPGARRGIKCVQLALAVNLAFNGSEDELRAAPFARNSVDSGD
jgi:hypothetical protein